MTMSMSHSMMGSQMIEDVVETHANDLAYRIERNVATCIAAKLRNTGNRVQSVCHQGYRCLLMAKRITNETSIILVNSRL